MYLSSFLNTIYWIDCLYTFICSCLLCQILIDHKVMGLFVHSLFCSLGKSVCWFIFGLYSEEINNLPRKGKQKKNNKQMRLYQTKTFLHSKGKHRQNKQPTIWENIFANTFHKGLMSKNHKRHYKTQHQKNKESN